MNTDRFTVKSQQAVQHAINLAKADSHQAVESGHIIKGIIAADENITSFLLQKLNVDQSRFTNVLDRIVNSYPKVSGGKEYFSQDSINAIDKADEMTREFGDMYVSVEHLFLGILSGKDSVAKMMKDVGITVKDTKKAIEELRKGAKVTGQTAEDTYDSLGRFAVNLNEMAKSGKLDPVIGRDEEI
ncbi:MAG: type VI secretion system ATPase TssH, partial [Bacteroidetes bacterium]|nr:type VI secretion system ATPase TssH [Bacteroidota bacterium]